MGRITFLRHAMPEVESGIMPAEWRLSAAGVAAAGALHIASAPSTRALSSPELKARQTTALALDSPLEAIVTDARFREVDREERVHAGFRDARRLWVAGRLDQRHRHWEAPKAAAQRFHEGLLAHAAEHLVVGTHGMVLTAWMVDQGLIAPGDEAVAFWEALALPDVIELTLPLRRVRAVRLLSRRAAPRR
jgi:broad specificity phosphatase PhoE